MPALYMNKEKEELRPVSHGIYPIPVPSLPTKPKSICNEISLVIRSREYFNQVSLFLGSPLHACVSYCRTAKLRKYITPVCTVQECKATINEKNSLRSEKDRASLVYVCSR